MCVGVICSLVNMIANARSIVMFVDVHSPFWYADFTHNIQLQLAC